MAGPWLTLAALPWGTILKQAPAVLATADALLRRSRARDVAPIVATTDVRALQQRIAELEQQQRANADLMKQLADQARAIAVAAQAAEHQIRIAYAIASAGVGLALVACLLAWFL